MACSTEEAGCAIIGHPEGAIRNLSDEVIMTELVRIAHFSTTYLTTKQRRIFIDASRRISDG